MVHSSPEMGEIVAEEGGVVDPVLSVYLGQFQWLLSGFSDAAGEQRLHKARHLGALSRDIRFRLGPPDDASPKLASGIVHLLQEAEGLRSEGDGREISMIFDHIRERAETILQRLSVRAKISSAT